MHRIARRHCLALLTCALAAAAPATWARDTQDAGVPVDKAPIAFADIVKSKDDDARRSGLKSAKAALIFPSIIKRGVLVGGPGGTGVLLVRGSVANTQADTLREAVAAAAC